MTAPDRIELLRGQTVLTGLDFVYMHTGQTKLDVFFLVDPRDLDSPLEGSLTIDQVTIRDAQTQTEEFPIASLSWVVVDGRQAMQLETPFPGGFQLYQLALADSRMDPAYENLIFSFKVECDSGLDCQATQQVCASDDEPVILPNYQGRDFWLLRQSLMDFASEYWPDWKDRLAADAGVMMAELFAALGDELAYTQDQIAHESHFDTARERRSLRQHARLVDYEIHDGLAATGWLTVMVNSGEDGLIDAGTTVETGSGSDNVVSFEIGLGLCDVDAGTRYAVDSAVNSLTPYIWDEDPPEMPDDEPPALWPPGRTTPMSCLPQGGTEMWLQGHHSATLTLTDMTRTPPGRWVLLRTDPANPAQTARRWPVRLVEVRDDSDPLPAGTEDVTYVRWEDDQALPYQMDLDSLTLEGNLVPITAGTTYSLNFSTGAVAAGEMSTRTVEREGPGGEIRHLLTLPGSDETPLTRLGVDPESADPEVLLSELEWDGASWVRVDPAYEWDITKQYWARRSGWSWRRSLLGVNSSLAEASHYTLDDGVWKVIVRHWRQEDDYQGYADYAGGVPRFEGDRLTHHDLAIGVGATIRFGDNQFARVPAEGTAFECLYRLGNGRHTNVAADTISVFADPSTAPAFVDTITNPLETTGGADPETAASARRRAPALYKTVAYRAVTEDDYTEAAERLSWIQRAGARMRWTGSWLSVIATADPSNELTLSQDRQKELYAHLNAFRQTGREVNVTAPRYGDIDLEAHVCVAPGYDRGAVKALILEALFADDGTGFFSADNFSFGTPLWRSALEATIQNITGVRAVGEIQIRRRGVFDWRTFDASYEPLANDEILRLANDPTRPEQGSFNLEMEGGS